MTADLWNKTVIIQVNECKLNSNVNMSGNDDDVRKVIIEIVTSDSGQCLVTWSNIIRLGNYPIEKQCNIFHYQRRNYNWKHVFHSYEGWSGRWKGAAYKEHNNAPSQKYFYNFQFEWN